MRKAIFVLVMSCFVPAMLASCSGQGANSARFYFKSGAAQLEIVSPKGVRVLVDVASKDSLSSPADERSILLTTHIHGDHYDSDYVDAFKGRKLTFQSGSIEQGDVRITGIVSSHGEVYDPGSPNPSNIIFLIEIGTLRIVHFGDTGQTAFSPAQLELFGKVDVAIMQLANDFADMSLDNMKGFKLMDQVKPGIIVPTHMDLAVYSQALKTYPAFFVDNGFFTVGKDSVPDTTHFFAFGDTGKMMLAQLGLKVKTWK
ncbi:MAG: MBL fold metallo-hydrolase [Spirochaetes bacterium]|nr:MBL fold metallo-hydrolase [Spirochaetota bacterium]